MSSRLCPFCMRMAKGEICPHCGKNVNYTGSAMHLPAGYVVSGVHPYVIGAALGQGGFGITYIALDMVSGQQVAIKEYFPAFCAGRTGDLVSAYPNQEELFRKSKERFLDEARTLKSLSDLKNIVDVLDFFEANNSAYLVMEFLDGSSLKEYAAKNGKFPAQEFLEQIRPLMEDIQKMHDRGVIHRDIAPDNIILLPNGQMKLIDFGAARSYVGDKSMTVVVKKGFAPLEQYLSKGAAACTDVYALAATIYYCITGTVPMDSADRQDNDIPLPPPSFLGADIAPFQEKALKKALEIQKKARTQSMQEFLDNLKTRQSAPKPIFAEVITATPPAPLIKKVALIITAVILLVTTVFGFLLSQPASEETEEILAETVSIPTEPTVEGPAWQKNVLMADPSYKKSASEFWKSSQSRPVDEFYAYFSVVPIYNTGIPRNKVTDVFFLDSLSTAPKEVYDFSASQDGSVLAWTEKNSKGALNLYIAGEGGVNGAEACPALFYGYTELESVNFNHCFFTDTTLDMSQLFAYCKNLKTVNLNGLNTSSVRNMSHMFLWCEQLPALDLRGFDTSKVADMNNMFCCCESLTSLDISSFDTRNTANMTGMFSNCNELTALDVSSFDTSSVTNMNDMFYGCSNLTALDLRNFDTANITTMWGMFGHCKKLTVLDLSNFDTAKVTNMAYMFEFCEQLESLDLSSFDTANVTDMSYMFYSCEQLNNLDLSNFDTSRVSRCDCFMVGGKKVNGRPWVELF